MKYRFVYFQFIFFLLSWGVFAQDTSEDSLDDIYIESIDDLFDDSMQDNVEENTSSNKEDISEDDDSSGNDGLEILSDLTAKKGGAFTISYAFAAGYAPGWSEAPWYWNGQEESFTNVIGADLTSTFNLDFQLSPQLRVYQTVSCDFPDYGIDMDTFWAEYNFKNQAFFKLGLFKESWGISRNYSYTNILNRIPEDSSGGDAYSFRVNLPVGVGGVQLLTMTRSGFVEDKDIENLKADDLGYGLKYNYAHPFVDINVAALYHELMPFRVVTTLKTTLFDSMEVYSEGLIAFPYDDYNTETVGSGSIGFIDDYFRDKLTVNAEYFYNGEVYTSTEETDDGWTEDEDSPFVKGHNVALNLYYKLGFASLNLFSRLQYNFSENTGKWAPGFRINPFDDLSIVLSCPIALGDRDGIYYSSNYDEDNRPFSFTLAVILSGRYKFAKYEKE